MTSAGGRCDLSRLSVHGSREEQGELGVRELENADSKFKNRTSPESEVGKAGTRERDTGFGIRGSGLGVWGRGATNSRPVLRGGRNPRDSGGVLLKLIHRAGAADIDSYVSVPTCIPVDKPSLSR